jgi:alpha-beta hydrolase superfamily lysophospholipase
MTKYYSLLFTLLLITNSNISSSSWAKSVKSSDTKPIPSSPTTSADEITIQVQVEKADKLYWQGNYKKAIDAYRNLCDSYPSYDQEGQHYWLSSIADCYCRLNDYQQAETIYQQIASQQKQIKGIGSPQFANCLIDLAACNYYLRHYHKAEQYCQKALSSLERAKTSDTLNLAKLHLGLAEIFYQQSKYKVAAQQYLLAIDNYDKLFTFSREDIIEPLMVALEGIGACYCFNKQYQTAAPYYQRLADIQSKIFGDKDVRYGWTLVTLSKIEHRLNNQEISNALYEKSVWIFRKANRDRLIAELQNTGRLTPELAQKVDHYTYGNSDQNKAKHGDSSLKKEENKDQILQCRATDRSLVKPGPWDLVTTKELDPPGWEWLDATQPLKGIIICVHGLGLNAKSYKSFANSITPYGYMVIAFDVRGFGSYLSSKVGDKLNFSQCLSDISTVLKIINQDNPGTPIYLLGESMGGAIALQVTASHPELMNGLICSVPAGSRYKASSTDLDVALHMVKGINKPFDIGTKLINQATQRESLKKQWQADPFNRLSLSPKELVEFAVFMKQNKAAATQIANTPVIIFQGVQDKLVKRTGTMEIYNSIPNKDKDLVLIGSSEHLIFENTICPKSTITAIIGWMEAHNKGSVEVSIK